MNKKGYVAYISADGPTTGISLSMPNHFNNGRTLPPPKLYAVARALITIKFSSNERSGQNMPPKWARNL